jgi:ABC-type lipoprotein release transport system permease subunit
MTFFQKQKYLIDFTLSSLLRRKAKNFSLLFVYLLIVFMLASVMLFTQAIRGEAKAVLSDSPEIIIQRMEAGRHALISEEYLAKIQNIRGVVHKSGRLWGYLYDSIAKANYTLMVAPDFSTKYKKIADGEIIIGAGIARIRGLYVDDYLSLKASNGKTHSFKIIGFLDNDIELISTDLILLSEKTYRQFFNIPQGLYTDLVLSVRNSREVYKIAEKIIHLLPDTRPILREEILRTYDSIFNWRQGIVFVLFIGMLLAFVIFAWDKASGLSSEEKREIGILKAIGWETNDILQMKFLEGFIISIIAFLVGYLLAYGHVFYTSATLFASALKGWAVLYPAFNPVPFIDGLQVATLFFFTVFPYVVATIFPIWHVAITDPDTVMR